jgi:hypothetical protein
MTTIDNLLQEILNHAGNYAQLRMSKRDFDTLTSLSSAVVRPTFITENQGNLLTKILRENYKKLDLYTDKIAEALVLPTWSKNFRHIEQIKTLKISNNLDGEMYLTMEITFSSQIRKVMNSLGKTVENLIQVNSGKTYIADLTEKNIVVLVEALTPLEFDIDEKVKNYYSTIKSWSETQVHDQFLLTNITHQNFQKAITADLGVETAIDQNIINDRSIRYQFFVENSKNLGENLTENLANRSKSKVWVDNKEHSLTSVFESILNLRRLPTLVVFENSDSQKTLKNMEILADSLAYHGIEDSVGVYFRLPNDDTGKKFNQLIASRQYNKNLDYSTKVAVVQSGKIPKFFLKNAWQPMSVIALDTKMGLRHGKTSVYSNCCDLIIEWADTPTMYEQRLI